MSIAIQEKFVLTFSCSIFILVSMFLQNRRIYSRTHIKFVFALYLLVNKIADKSEENILGDIEDVENCVYHISTLSNT